MWTINYNSLHCSANQMDHLKAINWDPEMVLLTEMADHLGIGLGSLMDVLMDVQIPKAWRWDHMRAHC